LRAALYYSNSDLRITQMPVPEIGKGELLLRVESCGICGSDVMEWYRENRVPLVLGHEISAIVAKAGEGVDGFSVGDRVSASHHVPCNECYYCKNGHHTVCDTLRTTNFYPGGFSEYVRLPKINVELGTYRLPDRLSYDCATFIEPLACVLRAQRVADIRPGQTILVIGSGIAGLLHIYLAKLKGAARVIALDICDFRLAKAKELGADISMYAGEYKPGNLGDVNSGRLADVVILCTQAQSAINTAFDSVERAGVVLFFAPSDKDTTVNLSVNKLFWRTERKLVSSYAASPTDHLEALRILEANQDVFEKMITHRIPLKGIGLGFKLVSEAKECLKVIIKPQK